VEGRVRRLTDSSAFFATSVPRGDHAAFGRIVERYRSMTCATAYSLLGDVGLSGDAAQEAFVVA
jgi:DNA-directed RNA polymerase specialized sigma24 family protein